MAAKTSLAEAAMSTSEDRSIQKASNESNVLKCPVDGINELCGSDERISESYSIAPSENQQTCGVEDDVNGVSELSIGNLPLSAIGDPSNLDAMDLLHANKGRAMQGIIEQV